MKIIINIEVVVASRTEHPHPKRVCTLDILSGQATRRRRQILDK